MNNIENLFVSILGAKLTENNNVSAQNITASLAELYELSALQGLTSTII